MDWKRFLFLHLPVALAVTAAAAEGAAWALRDVAPRRHDLDRLVAALDTAKLDAPVVLLGDSVTQDVMKTYRIAPDGVVANLTTNQASGLIGSALLLRRYLAHNAAPAHVVIASTPEFFAYQPDGAAARTYVTSVFTRAEERAELQALGLVQPELYRPAVLSLELRIAVPLGGLVGGTPDMLPIGEEEPGAQSGESGPILPGVARQIAGRRDQRLGLSPSARRALEDICALSARTGFTLHLVRAPMPESVLPRDVEQGPRQAEEIRLATAGCAAVAVDDINNRQIFPDHAFRDADHLRRPGWTGKYASLLASWVQQLDAHAAKAGVK